MAEGRGLPDQMQVPVQKVQVLPVGFRHTNLRVGPFAMRRQRAGGRFDGFVRGEMPDNRQRRRRRADLS